MSNKIADILSFICIAIVIAVGSYLYPDLPEQIPTHWNAAGEIDGYTAKPWGVMIMPIAAAVIFLIMKLIPVISPKGFRTDEFRPIVNIFQVTLVAFMSAIGVLMLLEAKGYDAHIDKLVFGGTGLLLIILGNFLGKVRKNFFLGIRTPWTLASDEVWSRTHRIGGRMLMLGGLLMLIGSVVSLPPELTVIVVVVLALIPVIYSYFLYRKLEGFEPDPPIDDDLGKDG